MKRSEIGFYVGFGVGWLIAAVFGLALHLVGVWDLVSPHQAYWISLVGTLTLAIGGGMMGVKMGRKKDDRPRDE